jgi:hypothetical protein
MQTVRSDHLHQPSPGLFGLEDPVAVSRVKEHFAPDGGAEREHNATSGSLGFGAIHYGLVANLKPSHALVIGSRHGYIPAIIALALKFNRRGTLDFVDANYSDAVQGFDTAYGGVGHWAGTARERFAPLELDEYVNVHVMRSSEFFATYDAVFQYVYLDGDHSYEGCRRDFEHAAARTEDGGLILLHDVCVTDVGFGVQRVFAELDGRRYGKILVPAWPGIGIVQVAPASD